MCWISLALTSRATRTLIALFLVPVLAVSQESKQDEAEPPAESVASPDKDFYSVFKLSPPDENYKENPEEKYQKSIVAAATLCQKSGRSRAECWEDASPAKCEALVFPALAERGAKLRAWVMCVRTCADAGYWSRTFGECRTDLDPVTTRE